MSSSRATDSMVGKQNAEVALSLVGYDDELKSAMEHVFGSTFICRTRNDAEKSERGFELD
ncbi:SMCs flexible hinge [Dillenia turbinata]|uniref:SMCs flexible hinge n=1 Tax=Dillenia turbinata TaxID=194707 RepID=A0AAN8VV25_9MAGN